ncbi:ATP-binding protein [Azospirillum picis]|uniref:histidine kinase n=1 Tax=Azospirillum picis TaxID=488438 RepID=A0ABU0MJT7_9PROT|nr:ATP-binding protein [Azospirillum picis]MBP2299738.1 signal transduction histidine kinase/ActR/RegA family two-component response regulator [Azospirillum picis]MDQ0533534.1 signal transduction histidine kinase/ActR/RegA family two-component response regulator [Azospirillum picis]
MPAPGPILILAPEGRDAEVIALVLAKVGLPVRACPDMAALCAEPWEDATAILVTEGALASDPSKLAAALEDQPPWSDMPVLLLTTRRPGTPAPERQDLLRRLGNVTLLDRPLRAETLQSTVAAALRARMRQFRTRTHLQQIEQAAALLERTVEERTQELRVELDRRRRLEAALLQAQKMEAIGQLTGGIAHDFNNLMQIVATSIAAIETKLAAGIDGTAVDVDRFVRAIRMASDRAGMVTRRLLAFSRRQPLQPASVDPAGLVTGMEELIRRSVGSSISVELSLAPRLWRVWADPQQIESALLNLVVNARDAMPGGGRLTIAVTNIRLEEEDADRRNLPPGDYVCLSVSDSGSGMAEDVKQRAFEPFFTTKPVGQGTGLGLSQIYGFARQSGGQAEIESVAGTGTTVRLLLPRHDGVPMGTSETEEADQTHPEAAGTILVVEDESLIRMVVTESLREAGYTVLEAESAEAALPILESDAAIDLLCTDVGLPGLNGRQLAEIAREERPAIRVLFVTGYAHAAGIDQEILGDNTRLLSKPVAIDTLLGTLGTMMGHQSSGSGRVAENNLQQ